MDGLRLALAGGDKSSLIELVATKDGLVSRRNPGLAADIRKSLDKLDQDIKDLGGKGSDLQAELKSKPDRLRALYDDLDRLQRQMIEASLVLELDVRSPAEKAG